MDKRHWADLSSTQKAGVGLFLAVDVALLVMALWDVRHRTDKEIRGDRRLWTGLVFVDVVGPLAYFTIGRKSFGQALVQCSQGGEDPLADIQA
jgi:bacteriorhodopsin